MNTAVAMTKLPLGQRKMLIGGEMVASASGQWLESRSTPFTSASRPAGVHTGRPATAPAQISG